MSARGCHGHVLKTAAGSSSSATAVLTRSNRSLRRRRTVSLYVAGDCRRVFTSTVARTRYPTARSAGSPPTCAPRRLSPIDPPRSGHHPRRWVGHCTAAAISSSSPTVPVEQSVDDRDRRQGGALIAVAALTAQHQVRQPVDADERPRQYMVNRIVGRKMRPAVEAVRTERVLERLAHRRQCRALSTEQVPGNVRHLGVEELVDPANVVHPHDLEGRFQQTRQPREPMRDTGSRAMASPWARSVVRDTPSCR